jgi:hypothetical protein
LSPRSRQGARVSGRTQRRWRSLSRHTILFVPSCNGGRPAGGGVWSDLDVRVGPDDERYPDRSLAQASSREQAWTVGLRLKCVLLAGSAARRCTPMTVDTWAATSWGSIGLMGPVPRLAPSGRRVCARKGARTLLAASCLWQQRRWQRDWFGQTTREERRPPGCAHVLCSAAEVDRRCLRPVVCCTWQRVCDQGLAHSGRPRGANGHRATLASATS